MTATIRRCYQYAITRITGFLIGIVLLLHTPDALAVSIAFIRVDMIDGVASPSAQGTGWGTDAYKYLQDGIDRAFDLITGQSPPDKVEIWVRGASNGTAVYKPGQHASGTLSGTGEAFALHNKIEIYGGFAGDETTGDEGREGLRARDPRRNTTILDGDVAGDDTSNFGNRTDNVEHVVIADNINPVDQDTPPKLDGFRIRGGNAVNDGGGGLFLSFSAAIVANCDFIDNESGPGGGGAHCDGSPVINGGGDPAITYFVSCRFLGNEGGAQGGGVWDNGAEVRLHNILFSGNTATIGAAALADNEDEGEDIRVCTMEMINCTVSRNASGNANTGALVADSNANLFLDNCIVWGNTADGDPGQIDVTNAADSGTLHCNIQGSGATGTDGNIDSDPLFLDADGGDNTVGTLDDNLHLQCSSPSVNTGDDALLPGDVADLDADGNYLHALPRDLSAYKREYGSHVDMGSYEMHTNPSCAGDCAPVNGDGDVDVNDLLMVITNWGTNGSTGGDIAPLCGGDNIVNVNDLLAVISHWGSCSGGGGSMPTSISDCMTQCTNAGLTGAEWSMCCAECIEWLCKQHLIDCDE
jgi:hypothetical protein